MAMDCCRKEYAELCEIHVRVDPRLGSNYFGFYERLRFGLLASSWLPRPLGIFLWRALNAILVVAGPAFTALDLVIAFIFNGVILPGIVVILFGILVIVWIFTCGVYNVVALTIGFVLLLGRSFRFCLSVLLNYVTLCVCHESSAVEWRGGAGFSNLLWEGFKPGLVELFWSCVPTTAPCWRPSLYYQEEKQRRVRVWKLWCREVVHTCDAIAI